MKHLGKLSLPIIVALVIVLGTIAIATAGFATERDITIDTRSPILITPDATTNIVVYKGATNFVEYTCTNNTDEAVQVNVSTSALPQGLTVAINPESFELAVGAVQVVTFTFEVALDFGQDNVTVQAHFAVV